MLPTPKFGDGPGPRPQPSAEDRAAAEAFVAETYDADPTMSRVWIANNRKSLLTGAANAFMQKRTNAEHLKAFAALADVEGEIARRSQGQVA